MARQPPDVLIQQLIRTLRERVRRFQNKYARLLRPGRQVARLSREQPTGELPEGALFASEGKLYQVIETGGGFNLARPWSKTNHEKVALVPTSIVARFYPVVAYGEPLPAYASKAELLDDAGRVFCFVFASASRADRAARLDERMALRAGVYLQSIRNGLLGLTDGLHVYRLYSHRPPSGKMFERLSLPDAPHVVVLDAADGPYFWTYLDS